MVTLKKGKDFFSFLVLLSAFCVVLGSVMFQTSSTAQESGESRLADISEINRIIQETGANWVAGETSLSGLPIDEKKKLLGSMTPPITGEEELLSSYQPLGSLPSSLDWRSNGGNFVTPIRNQSSCGSCWAFAATAALESATLIYSNSPDTNLNLSEQVMVSCGVSGSNDAGGCGGGYISYASDHIRNTGLPLETCYPYTATDGNCGSACANWQSSAYKIASWSWVATTAPTVDAIKNALSEHGPLVTTLRVYEDFYDYIEGVYSYVSGAYLGGHAVLLVGYNDNERYFIVKNSWGTWWGEDGYFKIAYSEVNGTTQFGDYTIAYGSAIPPNGETVSAPTSLSGTTSGITNTSYSYLTGGSTSSSGHSVQYLFDWGDSTNSGWLGVGTTRASKSWSSPGTYSVTTQARCSADASVLSSRSTSLDVTVAWVTVFQPNGEEIIPVGSPYTIRWSAPAQAVTFNLAYSTNNGSTWKTIAKNVTGLSYSWQVPALKKSQKSCRVRVIGFDSGGVKLGEDRSDSAFAILGVRVTAPTLGETLTSGSTHTITWETLETVGPVGEARIYYSKNGRGGWTLIDTVPGGTNSYLWTVPSTKGVIENNCKVKVVLKDSRKKTLTADVSEGCFTVQPAGSQ
jgi:C1A family cysteine protease